MDLLTLAGQVGLALMAGVIGAATTLWTSKRLEKKHELSLKYTTYEFEGEGYLDEVVSLTLVNSGDFTETNVRWKMTFACKEDEVRVFGNDAYPASLLTDGEFPEGFTRNRRGDVIRIVQIPRMPPGSEIGLHYDVACNPFIFIVNEVDSFDMLMHEHMVIASSPADNVETSEVTIADCSDYT